jgi:hypothetical protein
LCRKGCRMFPLVPTKKHGEVKMTKQIPLTPPKPWRLTRRSCD